MSRSAVALLRVSSEDRDGKQGLPRQRVDCERIAAAHDLAIIEWVTLDGVSGAHVLEDARFRAVLDRIADPTIEGLVVADLDRLMRPEDPGMYWIYGRLRNTATVLYTNAGPKDFRKDRLLMMIEGEIAAFERERIRDRMMKAKELHRRAGRHVAGPEGLPYGVAFDRAAGWSYRWPEAATARMVYERVLGGDRNWTRLAGTLGITRSLVARILANPIYAGVRRYDRRYPSARPGETRRPVPRRPDEVIEQTVLAPGLVPMGWWVAAQAILGERRRQDRAAPECPCVYRGFTLCGACGARMDAHRERRSPSWHYRCRDAARRGRTCPTGELVRYAVEDAADRAIGRELVRPERIAAALGALLGEQTQAEPDAGEVERRMGALGRERERVLESWERGWRGPAEAERRVREIEAEVRGLRAAGGTAAPAVDLAELAALLVRPFVGFEDLGAESKRQILAAHVRAVEVERAGRARARVVAVRLLFPAPASLPPGSHGIEERRAAWAAYGAPRANGAPRDGLRVPLAA